MRAKGTAKIQDSVPILSPTCSSVDDSLFLSRSHVEKMSSCMCDPSNTETAAFTRTRFVSPNVKAFPALCVAPAHLLDAHLIPAVLNLPEDLIHLVWHTVRFAVGAPDLYLQLVVAIRNADPQVDLETGVGDVSLDEATADAAVVLHVHREWGADDVILALVG